MRNILISGANKGIGLAIAKKLLTDSSDTFVFIGARDQGRGDTAANGLIESNAAWRDRIEVLLLDPTSAASVKDVSMLLLERGVSLYGIINNAGGFLSFSDMLDLHLYGMKRVVDAFVDLLEPGVGRIVNISSGGAPSCVAKSRSDIRALLVRSDLSWDQIHTLAQEVQATVASMPSDNDDEAISSVTGISWGIRGYGFTKALVNCYTALLQQQFPGLYVNACNPGFIETDLSRPYAVQAGKSPAEMGMRRPEEGASVPCQLMLGAISDSGGGGYYDCDGVRSGFDQVDPTDFDSSPEAPKQKQVERTERKICEFQIISTISPDLPNDCGWMCGKST